MIHKFEINDIKIVLDVNSGAVHIIDQLIWEILDFGEEFNWDEIYLKLGPKFGEKRLKEGLFEIEQLIAEGVLYSKWNGYNPVHMGKPVIKAMCLHAAHDCNMRCAYCFAGTGNFKGKRSLLDIETGKRALEFLIQHSGNRKNLEVDFFGGEPLLNYDVIKKLVKYGRHLEEQTGKKFKFTVTTNGLPLDNETIEYINKEFVNVVVSIDGREHIHNRMRKTRYREDSYHLILPKAQRLAQLRGQTDYYVRGTFTRYNLDFDKDVLHLADCGFKQISVEPVVAPPDAQYSIREEDLPNIFETYERLAQEFLYRKKKGNGFNYFHFQVDLEQGPCVAKRVIGCGAGNEYVAVTPEGDIYPCHQFVGDTEWKMGNVHSQEFDEVMQTKFANNNIFTKPECSKCWAKFYCSGGCPANGYHLAGSISKPYKLGCEMIKKRLECAIMIKAAENIVL